MKVEDMEVSRGVNKILIMNDEPSVGTDTAAGKYRILLCFC